MSSYIKPATILFKRGGSANLPTLSEGEPAFALDSGVLWVGGSAGNVEVTGGGGGATSLDGLTDVTLTSPSTNELLTYNGSIWVNQALTSASLNSLTDVTLTSPSTNDLLTYDGAEWVNQPIASTSLNALSDVNITAPNSNEVLTFSGAGSTWVNQTVASTITYTYADSTGSTVLEPAGGDFDLVTQDNVNIKVHKLENVGDAARVHIEPGTGNRVTFSTGSNIGINGAAVGVGGFSNFDPRSTWELIRTSTSNVSIKQIENWHGYNKSVGASADLEANQFYDINATAASIQLTLPDVTTGAGRVVMYTTRVDSDITIVANPSTGSSLRQINGEASLILQAGDLSAWYEFTMVPNAFSGSDEGWNVTRRSRMDRDWVLDPNNNYLTYTNGDVGIGTASPNATLRLETDYTETVKGKNTLVAQMKYSPSAANVVFPTAIVGLMDYESTADGTGFATCFRTFAKNKGNGTMDIRMIDMGAENNGTGTIDESVAMAIRAPVNNGGGAITENVGILIGDHTVGASNYAIKTGAGTVTFGDDVGIGTEFPVAVLDIDAGANFEAFRIDGDGSQFMSLYDNGTWTGYLQALTASFDISAENSVPMRFRTGGAVRMQVSSAGLLGINTANPQKHLHVDGSGIVENGLNVGSSAGAVLPNPGTGNLYIGADGTVRTRMVSSTGITAFQGILHRGTLAAPSSTADGDAFGVIALGYDGAVFANMAQVELSADGALSTGNAQGKIIFRTTPNGSLTLVERMRIAKDGGLQVGVGVTGGGKGSGTINVSTNIYKANTAYTNPDFVFEKHYTGEIVKYAKNERAEGYEMLSLEETEEYAKENLRLPRIDDSPAGIFTMADISLEKIEELFLHMFDLNKRVKELEKELKEVREDND